MRRPKRTHWLSEKWPLHAGIWLAIIAILCCAIGRIYGGNWS